MTMMDLMSSFGGGHTFSGSIVCFILFFLYGWLCKVSEWEDGELCPDWMVYPW